MGKPISIVILANCTAETIQRMLPEIMQQQYEAGYEVIVVRESMKGNVTDLLEDMMTQYKNLRTTFLPDKPQYVTDYEVEIMLGVKAARYDMVVMVSPWFLPPSDNWINDVSDILETTDVPLHISTPPYPDGTSFFSRRAHMRRLKKILSVWRKEHGYSLSDIQIEKSKRHLFSIAFSKHQYLDEPLLRKVIVRHEEI